MQNIKFRSVELRITNAVVYFQGLRLFLSALLEIWPTWFWSSWFCDYAVSERDAFKLMEKKSLTFPKSVRQLSHELGRFARRLSDVSIRVKEACRRDNPHGLPTRHMLVRLLDTVDKMIGADLKDLRQTQKMISGNAYLDREETIVLPLDRVGTGKDNL